MTYCIFTYISTLSSTCTPYVHINVAMSVHASPYLYTYIQAMNTLVSTNFHICAYHTRSVYLSNSLCISIWMYICVCIWQIWVFTQFLWICIAEFCLYCAPWLSTHSIQFLNYRNKTMKTFRVLYLSDSLERSQVCRQFLLRNIYVLVYIYICNYVWKYT